MFRKKNENYHKRVSCLLLYIVFKYATVSFNQTYDFLTSIKFGRFVIVRKTVSVATIMIFSVNSVRPI